MQSIHQFKRNVRNDLLMGWVLQSSTCERLHPPQGCQSNIPRICSWTWIPQSHSREEQESNNTRRTRLEKLLLLRALCLWRHWALISCLSTLVSIVALVMSGQQSPSSPPAPPSQETRKSSSSTKPDNLTQDSQKALRALIEEFQNHCRFILTCLSSPHNIIEAIHSRCSVVDFNVRSPKQLTELSAHDTRDVWES